MKPSENKNRICGQFPYCVVELGDILFFGLPINKYYEINDFNKDGHPLSDGVNLFELMNKTKITPIVFEK